MSLVLFLIGVTVYYFLYLSFFSKNEESMGSNENCTETDAGESGISLTPRQQIGSMFKGFVLNLIDPANNNYLDAANKKPNPFMFRAFVDRQVHFCLIYILNN